jgi:hypothetical protein
MAKLVAIGDSLTQGFHSGAIARPTLSYPSMIAQSLKLEIPKEFPIPTFPDSGLPLNLEYALRSMEPELGSQISTAEWIFRFPFLLSNFMDKVEDLYEGRKPESRVKYRGFYHNLAIFGFKVADSYTINGKYAKQVVLREEGAIEDDFIGGASAPMYRTALKILNPQGQFRLKELDQRDNLTQIDTLKKIVETEGVDTLILWLGSNDCLGTVVNLEIKETPRTLNSQDPEERRKYNLTHPDVFAQDYRELVERISDFLPATTQVFVGTVPHVTIPPITRGLGNFDGKYFDYYGRFFYTDVNFDRRFQKYLTKDQVRYIDDTVDQFNQIIRDIIAPKANWHLVEIEKALDSLAVKRNDAINDPARVLREYYQSKNKPNHSLLRLDPVPSTLLLNIHRGIRISGGLFGLDCVHPSPIFYGMVAELFLEAMKKVGIAGADPDLVHWREIIVRDSLLQMPPILWESVVTTASRNTTLWDVVFRLLSF